MIRRSVGRLIGRLFRGFNRQYARLFWTLNYLQYRADPRYAHAVIGPRVQLSAAELAPETRVDHDSEFIGRVSLGYGTTVGHHSILWARPSTITVGNYCQFAPYVSVYAVNHPVSYLTTYVNSKLFAGELKGLATAAPVNIGHDVWLGHGAIVLPGVTIGNGAIIGGSAVVTRDIPPYTIAGGNPAKPIKLRFDPRVIELLAKFQWWNFTTEQLEAYRELFFVDLNQNAEQAIALLSKYLEAH